MHPIDPAGFEIYFPEEQARARALPTAALVAVLAERGELPAVAQCGQCLADRQQAKAALPRTPHAVLTAMRQAYNTARFAAHVAALRAPLGTAEETSAFATLKRLETWRLVVENEAASEAALGEDYGTDWTDDVLAADYEARLAGTRPLDAPPPEAQ